MSMVGATRFTSSSLDLSNFSSSAIFDPISFEIIRSARIADLQQRLIAAGWQYDVVALETDPGIYLQETGAYREMLTLQAIDDAQKAVLLAFAQGPFLDRLGDDQGTARMPNEIDDRYRGRIQLAPEAFSATGTPGGYIYYAMGADPTVADVGCAVLNQGTPSVMVALTVMSDGSDGNYGVPSQSVLNNVYKAVMATNVKQLTDTVSVNGAIMVPYTVQAVLNILPGPDPSIVLPAAQAALNAAAAAYHRLVMGVPISALQAALFVPGVDSVTWLDPTANIVTNIYQFGQMISSNLSINVLNEPAPPTEASSY